MLGHSEPKNTITPSFLLRAWDYVDFSLTPRMKNSLIYGMGGFIAGITISLSISEMIAGGYRLHVLKEETCNYEEKHAEEYGCNFDSASFSKYGKGTCREFLNETNSVGKPAHYYGPLVNCTSTDQANELVEIASEYGEAQRDAWYPGAAKTAAYCSLFVGVGFGAAGLLYGFFKKPAQSSNVPIATSNNITPDNSKHDDHYLTLKG